MLLPALRVHHHYYHHTTTTHGGGGTAGLVVGIIALIGVGGFYLFKRLSR